MEKQYNKSFFTRSVSAGTRIYYFDAFKDTKGHPYISISEIPTAGKAKRQRIFIHAEDVDKFASAFADIVKHFKKSENGKAD